MRGVKILGGGVAGLFAGLVIAWALGALLFSDAEYDDGGAWVAFFAALALGLIVAPIVGAYLVARMTRPDPGERMSKDLR